MSASPYVFDVTQADFEEKVLVASTRVPVLVDFWAPWCAPCRQLTPVLEAVVDSYRGQVLLAKVNTDEQMQLAALFGIRSLPTVMLVRDGRPVDGFLGAQPESAIRMLLAPHLGEIPEAEEASGADEPPAYDDPAALIAMLRERVAAEPDKGEHKLELAQALAQLGEVAEVRALLDALPPALAEGDAAKALRARLDFVAAVDGAPPLRDLAVRVATHPEDLQARHWFGVRLLLDGQEADAVEQFLEIMRRDRGFRDDLGRRTLISAFAVMQDGDLVGATRRRMASMLF